jgi:hypothetical protein
VKKIDPNELIKVLGEAKEYLARPDNDFAWSTWNNYDQARKEIDDLIMLLNSDNPPSRSEIEFLFLPTGPIQEVSVSSGWGKEFLSLAGKFDVAVNRAFGPDPRIIAAHKAELESQMQQMFGGGLRWFCTILSLVAIGFAVYMHLSGDRPEVYFPIHMQGEATFYSIVISAVIFGILAIANWISWKKKRPKN